MGADAYTRLACVAASARSGIGANTAERPYVQVHRFRAFLRCCMRMRCNISAWVVLADAWGCMAVGADAYSRLACVAASARSGIGANTAERPYVQVHRYIVDDGVFTAAPNAAADFKLLP